MSDITIPDTAIVKAAIAATPPADPKAKGKDKEAPIDPNAVQKELMREIVVNPPGSAQTGDVTNAAKEAMRKFKVKIEGKEVDVDEKELIRGYGHQKVANKALQEGKALRKQAEDFVAMLRDEGKLKDVLQKLGHDPRKLSEKILAQHLEDELMDPRDRELRDAKAKLAHIDEMDKKQKEAIENQRMEHVKQRFMKEYERDFVEALDSSGLPATKPMVAEMAKYISRSAKIGFKMSAKEAAQLVKEDIEQLTRRVVGDSDGDRLVKLLGDNVANKIRKYDTDRIKTPEQSLQTPEVQNRRPREFKEAKKRMSVREWQLMKRGLK